ncbi:hypothetical protein DCO58_11885 [Helicobacter saguini]|uniref:Uncharacterized protein n=1 Tax=Helicobacter saguini TaxID=1548018 RepID=A0A347VQB1_9HELI|nr:hypothetical protein [Helicobacter saguini]MWV61011.1 hypothetical protein [Helicobacter saguini]MWV68320.1 hypothetical protein [Helicobacter saguini]MWV70215.1 hypothetical protein [Helicobacter saguini]MWV72118.1 hypothetical protein [Helicobacter saguini]TLD91622.1 hypothetical protein LS64_011560 [Helicobacter saguini]
MTQRDFKERVSNLLDSIKLEIMANLKGEFMDKDSKLKGLIKSRPMFDCTLANAYVKVEIQNLLSDYVGYFDSTMEYEKGREFYQILKDNK